MRPRSPTSPPRPRLGSASPPRRSPARGSRPSCTTSARPRSRRRSWRSPGRSTTDEWEFIKRHTLIGERIVAAAPALAHIAPVVRSSHERQDGRGYPDGLAADAIPLGARIVAVVDAFDAMVTHRPYKPAVSAADALAELRRCAGSQFDPLVVDAFVGVIERPQSSVQAA